MKKSLIYICILLTSISCQTETNTKEILESDPLKPDTITLAKKQQLASGECQFILNNEAIEFTWSAFKTTLREEVKGSFDEIAIENSGKGKSIDQIVNGSTFTIDLNSLNSQNAERDKKIMTYFFGQLRNKESFHGKVTQCVGNDKQGSASVLLNINDIENTITLNYLVRKNYVEFGTSLDLMSWKTQKALEALNNACLEQHKGGDGKSKTWSDMNIRFKIPYTIECK